MRPISSGLSLRLPLPLTVVRTPAFYDCLTAIDGTALPHFLIP